MSLVTGDAVVLEQRFATVATRTVSIAIDMALQLGVLWFALLISAFMSIFGPAVAATSALVLVVTVIVGYPVAMESLAGGRTLGKMALGLRVVRDDGGPVRFWQALVRGLAGFGELWLSFGAGAALVSLVSGKGKRVGDLLAGTIVVRDRVPLVTGPRVRMPNGAEGWASTLQLSALRDDLALQTRQFLTRGTQLDPRARHELGLRLATAVSEVVTPAPPAGMPVEVYLSAVLAERTRREILRMSAQLGRTQVQQLQHPLQRHQDAGPRPTFSPPAFSPPA